MKTRDHFVEDGDERYLAVLEAEIRSALLAEYAEQLAKASIFQKLRLHRAIRREIRRRLTDAISPRALY
jgi:hypothetical protein